MWVHNPWQRFLESDLKAVISDYWRENYSSSLLPVIRPAWAMALGSRLDFIKLPTTVNVSIFLYA